LPVTPKGFWPQIDELGAPFLRDIGDGRGRGCSLLKTAAECADDRD
jgi:hypothetical protein